MVAPYSVSSSTLVQATPEEALDAILAAPLEDLFSHRAGPIPPIRESRAPQGAWGTVGQDRTLVLGDGNTILETLVAVDRPGSYRYRLTDFTGPFKLLVATIDGSFTFTPEGTGTRATWSWSLHATNPATRLLLPVLGVFWRRYAAGMWPRYSVRAAA
jgi:hypothetical protein